MGSYSEWCGVVPLNQSMPCDQVAAIIAGAIGKDDQERFFPIGDVIEPGDDPSKAANLCFNMIPEEGCCIDMVEKAMLALAPYVDTSPAGYVEIEMVPGMNVGGPAMYRFIDGRVEVSSAALCSNSPWCAVRDDGERIVHGPEQEDSPKETCGTLATKAATLRTSLVAVVGFLDGSKPSSHQAAIDTAQSALTILDDLDAATVALAKAEGPSLTRDDCVEIACALESKRIAIKDEWYEEDEPGDNEKWIAHLESILKKIGPDGEHLVGDGR